MQSQAAIAALLTLSFLNSSSGATVFDLRGLHAAVGGMPGELEDSRDVRIGKDVTFRATIAVTNKGNGTLSIANLRLRVYDDHDDGLIYQGRLLDIAFVDLSGGGYKDLIVSGCAIHTGEKEDAVPKYEGVVFVYKFLPKERKFELAYRRASFSISE